MFTVQYSHFWGCAGPRVCASVPWKKCRPTSVAEAKARTLTIKIKMVNFRFRTMVAPFSGTNICFLNAWFIVKCRLFLNQLPRPASLHNHRPKNISLEHHQNSDQSRERQTVKENPAQDVALVSFPPSGRARDDNRLRINHFSHHAAGAIRRAHQNRTEPELRRRDLLQAAKQHIR